MATFILTWNGSESAYPTRAYASHVRQTAQGDTVPTTWSMGSRRSGITAGDRVFLLRQGTDRGVVAAGRIRDATIRQEPRWDDTSRNAYFASIQWETVLPVEGRLPIELLRTRVADHHWDSILSSGQQLNPPSDAQLEQLWDAHLSTLRISSGWDTPPGARLTRGELAKRYGGGRQRGIEPSRATPNVLLFSDPDTGHSYGYDYDGWNHDHTVYLYTGEGRYGPQQLRAGNLAISRHHDDGRALRLFVADGTKPGTNTKLQCYLGEFRVDPKQPYLTAEAPDLERQLRTVYVFRLLPVGEVLRRSQDLSAAGNPPAAPDARLVPAEHAAVVAGYAEAVPVEALTSTYFDVQQSTATTAIRREAELAARFQQHLTKLGHRFGRYRIRPPGELRDLYTDVFDQTANVLYEAKGVSTREAIRMAVGQLLDYRRHIHPTPAIAVLLPTRPSDDLLQLLRDQGIGCTVEAPSGHFENVLS